MKKTVLFAFSVSGFITSGVLLTGRLDGSSSSSSACGNSFCIGVILVLDHGATTLTPGIDLARIDIKKFDNDITILTRNSELNPEVADSIVDEFIDEGVDGIIGAYSSEVSLSIVDKVARNGNVLISPSNTLPALSEYKLAF